MNYNDVNNPYELLQYMTENIKYGFVGKNGKIYKDQNSEEWENDWYSECIVQDGDGLIKSQYGTCWDQVELERKWFTDHNYQYKTIFMWFEVNEPNNKPTHTFLIYFENGKWYWFEHSFGVNRGIHEFTSEEVLIEYVKNKQLEFAMQTGRAIKEDINLIRCYEYSKPEPNLGVDDYIYHVTNSMAMIK